MADFKDWPLPCAIATYSKPAAATLRNRGIPKLCAGTIYSLSWHHVRPVANMPRKRRGGSRSYQTRTVHAMGDSALDEYVADAPSRHPQPEQLLELHTWTPERGDPPSWIWDDGGLPEGSEYAVGLARWLAKGAPLVYDGYKMLAIDEAQDMSPLEMAGAMALLAPDGEALAVGDPGQSIFLANKGWPSDKLPPAWEWASECSVLEQGYRMGAPATDVAARILAPFYDRPAKTFTASHRTDVHAWTEQCPESGLVLGLSRYRVRKFIKQNHLPDVGVVPDTHTGVVDVMSIHAAKGHEADDVYILPWGRDHLKRLDNHDPEALKVLYTACTRARKNLYLPVDLYRRYVR